MSNKETSQLNPYINPDQQKERLQIIDSMYNDILNTLIKRKLRPVITPILRIEHGEEYANNHWDGTIQDIINAHLASRYPARYSRAINADLLKKIKAKYSLQLQFIETISKSIDEGRNLNNVISIARLS
jgi:hypothetical protein